MLLNIITRSISARKIRIDTVCICVLFFLCTVFPFQFYTIKIAAVCFFALQIMAGKKILKGLYNSQGGVFWGIVFITSNVFFLCLGEFYGNQAIHYYFKTEILWFILYLFLFSYMDVEQFFTLLKVICVAVIIILFMGIVAFLCFNFFQQNEFWGFKATVRPGYPFIAIAGGAITPVIYFGSLLILFGINRLESKWILMPLLLFVIATSRRSLMLVLLLAPAFYIGLFFFFVKSKSDRKIIRTLVRTILFFIVLIAIAVIIYDYFSPKFDVYNFIAFFKNAFKLTRSIEKNIDNSTYERAKQSVALIEGWKEHIILGNGIAANASVIRSKVPGMYELTYLAILFQRGIIGSLIYVFELLYLIVYLIYYGIRHKEIRAFCFSFCSAFLCFIIANGTNPYLEAFDYLWFIFVPFAIVKLISQDPSKFIIEYQKYANRK